MQKDAYNIRFLTAERRSLMIYSQQRANAVYSMAQKALNNPATPEYIRRYYINAYATKCHMAAYAANMYKLSK